MLFVSLLNLPSAIFILVPVFGAFMASQFSTQQGIKVANSIILQTGMIGTLIGLVTMLGNMSDPAALGLALSVASLPILYALIASSVLTLSSLKLTLKSYEFRSSYSITAVMLWIVVNLWAIFLGSSILAFSNIPSLIFVTLSIVIITIVSRANVAESLKLCGEYLPYAGLIGFFMGISSMIINLGDPRSIGPSLAFSFLTLLYTNWISVAIKLGLPKNAQEYKSSSWQYLGYATFSLILSVSILLSTLLIN